MKPSLSSRQRMLAAVSCQPPDHTPCAFMLFKGLHTRSRNYLDFLEAQLALGLDTVVQLPPRSPIVRNDHYNLHGLPVRYGPQVQIVEWKEKSPGEEYPILVKEYRTPAGTLRAEVRQTRDWPWGDHLTLFDDYIEPRSRKFLIESINDLETLRCLLVPPTEEEAGQFLAEAQPYLQFAQQKGLLVTGGWGVGADLIGWLSGLVNMIKFTRRQPEFIQAFLDIIAAWNRTRMEVILSAGIDLFIKRAWYENCDFWTPADWKQFIQPILKQDVSLAHEHGARFGYILTSSAMPLLEPIIETGVDVLIGVDPLKYDLGRAVELSDRKLSLWGGVNGPLTVELGTPNQVAREVEACLDIAGKTNGFILSPVDNVRELSPEAEANILALIKAWKSKALKRQGISQPGHATMEEFKGNK
ncbi:MAG: uroporphyrinogen decarboxylase family protein [Chloroflexota bacterium]